VYSPEDYAFSGGARGSLRVPEYRPCGVNWDNLDTLKSSMHFFQMHLVIFGVFLPDPYS